MLTIEFEGWFQCRLATDPDPYNHPTGVSGWTFSFGDEPDFDRVIRFHNPQAPRLHGPPVGVRVVRVLDDGVVAPAHPLEAGKVHLLGNAVFEGRNGVIAASAEEPVVPFEILIRTSSVALQRADPVNLANPVDLARRQPNAFEQNSMRAADGTGIFDYGAYRRQRRTNLQTALDAETDPLRRLVLEQRIAQLDESEGVRGDIRNASLGFLVEYAHTLTGPATVNDPGNVLGGNVGTTVPWSIAYWMGAWDADALCGFVRGQLTVPIARSIETLKRPARRSPLPAKSASPLPNLESTTLSAVDETRRIAALEQTTPPPHAAAAEAVASRAEFERKHGLRFVLECHPGADLETLRWRMRDLLGERVQLEPLFPELPEDQLAKNLSRFYVATLPGVTARDLEESPFEWAYRISDAMPEVLRVEPDTPFAFYPPVGEVGLESTSFACTLPEIDVPPDTRWSVKNIRADRAWAITPPQGGAQFGEGILVGHPDTGWAPHDDLDPEAIDLGLAFDLVDEDTSAEDPLDDGFMLNPGHGTATGSVIVSRTTGLMSGVAPRATLVPIRCTRSVVIVFNATDLARAIRYAADAGCHVVSMSLGGPPRSSLRAAVDYAVARNVIVAAAAGNCVGIVTAPALYDSCIGCAGSNFDDDIWPGSCRGSAVDISAPAQFVYAARRTPGVASTSAITPGQGTSYAVSHVAGVAALWLAFHGRQALLERYSGIATLQSVFKQLLKSTAREPFDWDTDHFGAGVVDAEALLQAPLPDGALESISTALKSGQTDYWADLERMLGPQAARAYVTDLFETTNPAEISAMVDRFGAELCEGLLKRDARAAGARTAELEALAQIGKEELLPANSSKTLRRAV
jgi:subtilisin family serine protease